MGIPDIAYFLHKLMKNLESVAAQIFRLGNLCLKIRKRSGRSHLNYARGQECGGWNGKRDDHSCPSFGQYHWLHHMSYQGAVSSWLLRRDATEGVLASAGRELVLPLIPLIWTGEDWSAHDVLAGWNWEVRRLSTLGPKINEHTDTATVVYLCLRLCGIHTYVHVVCMCYVLSRICI